MSYKYAPGIDPLSFVFPTDRGWLYIVTFTNRSANFEGIDLLENNQLSFEIDFSRSELDHPLKGNDPLVALTLGIIIQSQLEAMGELPIYYFVCEINDQKQAGRAHLFTKWFESGGPAGWDLVNFEMEDSQENGLLYYAGLLVHVEHPNCALIPDVFAQFLEQDVTSGKFIRRR